MKSRIPVGLVMMLAALLMSFVPAATVTIQPAAALSTCDWAQFISDVTVPDGTTYAPGATFTKTWKLKNIGTCTWSTSYSLVFVSGERMGGPTSVNLPSSVAPGQTVDITLNNLTAPSAAGHYIGYWQFKNASGVLFGIGSTGDKPWWVEINVSGGGTTSGVAYDFAANYCSATWYSIQGNLPCPGTDGDSRGFVLQVNQPQLENGTTASGLGLITEPQNTFNGDIHGVFPAFHVQSGDKFRSVVNCAFGATSCFVTFRLDYQIGSGPINTLWTFREKYEGLFFQANVDLSQLAGQDVKFIMTVLSTGSAVGDRALWSNPVISRAGATPPPPPPPNARNFDFGTSTSPVATGYTRVTETTAYAPGSFGWVSTTGLESRDRTSSTDPLKRDFVMSSSTPATFKVDLPNGIYAVTTTMGDNDFAHDNMVVKANGLTVLGDVDTAAGAYSVNTFTATVSSGSMTLDFSDAGGSDSTWVVNGISISTGAPPPAACDRAQFVTDVTVPDGTVFAPGAAFTKTWRFKNVGTCTWTTSYAMVFDYGEKLGGPDSVPMPKTVVPGDTVDVSVNLTAPSTAGSYRGFWKFQNPSGIRFGLGAAGVQAWWVDIRVSGTTTGKNFDFGTSTSPVASGYTRVTEATAYSSGGFGWTDTSTLESRDRSGISDDLKRDFVMSSSAARTFKVDLANGTYAVNVTMGDHDFAHDNMVVKANGTTVLGDVDTAVGAFASNTFTVVVTGGSLALEFSDAGGADPSWVVNAVSITPSSSTPAGCDRAQFMADVNVPDGTTFAPNAAFTKTWRLKNVGTCTWTTSYALVFDTGAKMGGPDSVPMPKTVAPGDTVDVSVNLTAPSSAGSYRGFWKFQNASGVRFGLGADGTKSWWVDIRVSGTAGITPTPGTVTPSPTSVAGTMYDFAANACQGVWFSGAGQLPCPGTDGDQRGFVLKVTNPQLENGTNDPRMGLITYPQNVFNGYIQGIFPPYRVKAGDRFRSIVNCAYGATSCYVVFRLDYQTGTGPITTFWAFVEKYEGQYFQVDLDLSSLVGQDIKFILTVLSTGSPTGDRALWVAPIIYNSLGVAPTTTPAATATGTSTAGWNSFQNSKYGFSFKYPPGSTIATQTDNAGRVTLPFTAGTNLADKYVDVSIVEGAATCKSPNGMGPQGTSSNVTINGIQFLKETQSEGAAGNLYDWTAFSTTKGNACISLTFVLHSINPGVYPTPPPVFNKAAESAVFDTIMSTFAYTSAPAATATNTPPAPTATATNTPPAPTATAGTASVSISNFSFQPGSLQVKAGTTVQWTNNDSTAHTVTSNTSVFDSGTLAVGSTFSFQFNQTGTFAYHCNIHPTMTGTITVVP